MYYSNNNRDLIEQVKVSLRIRHNKLDDEIRSTILVAENEMERLNVITHRSYNPGDLRLEAIKTYCKAVFSDEKYSEKYIESFKYQIDCLSKTNSYRQQIYEDDYV